MSKKRSKLNKKRRRHQAEAAAELSVSSGRLAAVSRDAAAVDQHREAGQAVAGSRQLGVFALGFAIASWLIWPILLGLTSAVMGYMAYRQGSRTLGIWSISLGLIAMLSHLIVIPIYFALS